MNTTNDKERIDYLDSAKAIGIIFVVVFHLIGSIAGSDPKPFFPYITRYIVAIALPIFFIVSGMLFRIKRPDNKSLKKIIKHKSRGLMIPYISFGIIGITIYAIQFLYGANDISSDTLINSVIYLITLRGFSVFWFLPTLFLAEMLFTWLYKCCKRPVFYIGSALGAIIVLIIYPIFEYDIWNTNYGMMVLGNICLVIGRALLAIGFLLVGYGLMELIVRFKPDRVKCLIIGCVLMIAQAFVSTWVKGVNINVLSFGNGWFFFLSAVIGSTGVILLCKAADCKKILPYVGKQSLIIMATHMDFGVLFVSSYLSYKLVAIIPVAKELALYGMMVVFIILMEALLIWIFNKYLYRLLGRTK